MLFTAHGAASLTSMARTYHTGLSARTLLCYWTLRGWYTRQPAGGHWCGSQWHRAA